MQTTELREAIFELYAARQATLAGCRRMSSGVDDLGDGYGFCAAGRATLAGCSRNDS